MRMNWFVWSGVYRGAANVPTVVVDVRLDSWALPLAVYGEGPLLGKFGLTFGIGPLWISWSRM